MPRLTSSALLCATMIALVACSSGTPQLMNLRNTEEGPDEFAVLPTAPLEIPENLASLPEPTPGAPTASTPTRRLTRSRRLAETQPARAVAGADLVSYTTRFGVSERHPPGSRRRGRRLPPPQRWSHPRTHVRHQRLFRGVSKQSLDRYAELERLRRWAFARRPHRHPPSRQAVTASSGRLMPPLRSICH
jgi:hypothetical protein